MKRRNFLQGLAAAVVMPTMLRELVREPEPEFLRYETKAFEPWEPYPRELLELQQANTELLKNYVNVRAEANVFQAFLNDGFMKRPAPISVAWGDRPYLTAKTLEDWRA